MKRGVAVQYQMGNGTWVDARIVLNVADANNNVVVLRDQRYYIVDYDSVRDHAV